MRFLPLSKNEKYPAICIVSIVNYIVATSKVGLLIECTHAPIVSSIFCKYKLWKGYFDFSEGVLAGRCDTYTRDAGTDYLQARPIISRKAFKDGY